jgi:arylsulfatase A-like enzyme
MAANLLNQFRGQIDTWLHPGSFSEVCLLPSNLFDRDANAAYSSLDHLMFDYVDAPGSLILGLSQRVTFEQLKKFNRNYPRGLPQPHEYPIIYKLPNVFDGLLHTLDRLPEPYFSYIHIFSPHAPYNARRDFIGIFDDGWKQIQKPESPFSEGETYESTEQNRVWYDEYIANVDAEFGRFMDYLQDNGTLDHSYLVVTSDHGELLERGVKGHVSPLLYEPLVRVPLLISTPGQAQGRAFHASTSSVDLLPSLLSVTGHEVPEWAEGQLLPGLGGEESPERSVFVLEAKSSSAFRKLPQATFAVRQGQYKTTLYRGYDAYDRQDAFELFDLESDPEEMNDLVGQEPSLAAAMRDEILARFEQFNRKPPGG